jgi:hypothetical protein
MKTPQLENETEKRTEKECGIIAKIVSIEMEYIQLAGCTVLYIYILRVFLPFGSNAFIAAD